MASTCANNGYDYADVFTPDGVSSQELRRRVQGGGRVRGGVKRWRRWSTADRGCKTKLVWTDWSHLMLNHRSRRRRRATGRIIWCRWA
jgi:hypothetical protein